MSKVAAGDRVAVTDYGVAKVGTVTRTNGALVWVVLEGTRRERWFHAASLTLVDTPAMRQFIEGYVECAFWADTPEEAADAGDAPGTVDALKADARAFFRAHCLTLSAAARRRPWDYLGHDLWLTRQGHGAGFWDRGLGAIGDRLTRAAERAGSRDLYVGDDGQLYVA